MAKMLRAIADAGPVDGLPAARLINLVAGATGWDIRYLRRSTDTLTAMPGVWAAFDHGDISWSQVRGITTAAKGLSVPTGTRWTANCPAQPPYRAIRD